jgi:hypothetical protein
VAFTARQGLLFDGSVIKAPGDESVLVYLQFPDGTKRTYLVAVSLANVVPFLS